MFREESLTEHFFLLMKHQMIYYLRREKKKKSNESLLKNKTTLISATLKLLKGKAWSHNSVAAYHHGLQSYEYIDIAF